MSRGSRSGHLRKHAVPHTQVRGPQALSMQVRDDHGYMGNVTIVPMSVLLRGNFSTVSQLSSPPGDMPKVLSWSRQRGEFSGAGDLQKGITTHLVVKEADKEQASPSLKFLRAVEWGIPVTRWGLCETQCWLRACAEARAVLPIQPHHVIPHTEAATECSGYQASSGSGGRQQDVCKEPLTRSRSSSSAETESHHSESHLDSTLPDRPLRELHQPASACEDESSSDQTCSLPSSPTSSAALSPTRQETSPRCTEADQRAVPIQHAEWTAQSYPDSGTGARLQENGSSAAAEAQQAYKGVADSSYITKRRGPLQSRDTASAANSSSSEDDVEFAQRLLGDSHISPIRPNLQLCS